MRLLVFPTYSNTVNLSGCSAYNLSMKFIRNVLENNKDVFVYWALPSFEDGLWTNNITPLQHDRLKIFHVPMVKSQYAEVGFITKDIYDLFNQIVGKYHIDAVICERPAAAMVLRKLIQHYFDARSVRFPVFLREPFIKTAEMHGISEVEEIAQTVGYLSSHVIVYSKNDHDELMRVARKYLNPASIRRVMERIRLIASGTDCDELDKHRHVKKRDKFTVILCERMAAQQQSAELTTVLDHMYSAGHNIHFIISTQAGGVKINERIEDWADILTKNSRDNYLKLMPACHAFLSTSVHHSYPQALMEQLYCGLIGVFPRRDWFTSIMPEYPFMYAPGDFVEAGAMLRWISENYNEAKKRVAYIQDLMREKFNVRKQSLVMFDWIREEVLKARSEAGVPGGFVDVFKDIDLADGFTLDDALDWFKSKSKYKIELREDKGGFSTSKSLIVELLHRLGYEDSCDKEQPTFFKVIK